MSSPGCKQPWVMRPWLRFRDLKSKNHVRFNHVSFLTISHLHSCLSDYCSIITFSHLHYLASYSLHSSLQLLLWLLWNGFQQNEQFIKTWLLGSNALIFFFCWQCTKSKQPTFPLLSIKPLWSSPPWIIELRCPSVCPRRVFLGHPSRLPAFSTWLRKHSPGGNVAVILFLSSLSPHLQSDDMTVNHRRTESSPSPCPPRRAVIM